MPEQPVGMGTVGRSVQALKIMVHCGHIARKRRRFGKFGLLHGVWTNRVVFLNEQILRIGLFEISRLCNGLPFGFDIAFSAVAEPFLAKEF